MNEAKRAAARRGELRVPLPVGFVCDDDGNVVIDNDGVYDLSDINDRLLLGLKSQMSEALCRRRHRASYADPPVMPTTRLELVVVSVAGCGCPA